MATIRFVLDDRRTKKDGTCPVYMRIYHESRFWAVHTGVYLSSALWDESTNQVSKAHPMHQQLNLHLREMDYEYKGKIMKLYRSKPQGFTFEQLKEWVNMKEEQPYTLQTFWENEILLLEQCKRYGNARNHRLSLNAIRSAADTNLPMEAVNYNYLKAIETTFLKKGLKTNSIGVYMRSLRAIYNIAINKDVVDGNNYPFRKYKIRTERVVPHVMTLQDTRKLFSYRMELDHPLYKTLLLSRLNILLCGINFHDMVHLSLDNIKQGRISYVRSKTRKLYSICILHETERILEALKPYYNGTICGILTKDDLSSGMKLPYVIRDKNKQFNKRLAQLSRLLGLSLTIRSYTFRYTIANLCKQLGYDIGMISELLGHNYGNRVTSGYLMAYDKDRIDGMMREVARNIIAVGD